MPLVPRPCHGLPASWRQPWPLATRACLAAAPQLHPCSSAPGPHLFGAHAHGAAATVAAAVRGCERRRCPRNTAVAALSRCGRGAASQGAHGEQGCSRIKRFCESALRALGLFNALLVAWCGTSPPPPWHPWGHSEEPVHSQPEAESLGSPSLPATLEIYRSMPSSPSQPFVFPAGGAALTAQSSYKLRCRRATGQRSKWSAGGHQGNQCPKAHQPSLYPARRCTVLLQAEVTLVTPGPLASCCRRRRR